MVARSIFWMALGLALGACSKMAEEEISGCYFIDNRLTTPLHVEALSNQGPTVVLVDSIPAHTMEAFMNMVQGIEGAMPSNFLQTLVITSNDDTVYSGVNNADWLRDDNPMRTDLVLVIE